MINSHTKSFPASAANITPSGQAAITIIFTVEPHVTKLCNIMRWCNIMKDHSRMVFQSGMSEASASINTSQCVCWFHLSHSMTWVSQLQDLIIQHKTKKQRLLLRQVSRFLLFSFSVHFLPPSTFLLLLLFYFLCKLLCLPCCIPWPRSPTQAPCFLRARISPVRCPISENETRESGYRNAPFPPDSLSITMMESSDDTFYCICWTSELTLEITHTEVALVLCPDQNMISVLHCG